MTQISFAQRLQQARPILADGATGTMLHQRAKAALRDCFDALNLTQPDVVRSVHYDYIQAGAELVETNSFGANAIKLAEHGLLDKLSEINGAAVRLAREAAHEAGREVYVAGAIGPLGVRLKPYGRLSREEAAEAFRPQIEALLAAGVDLLLFETFAHLDELLVAVETAHALAGDTPIVAQATFGPESLTSTGHSPARVANDLQRAGAALVGVNCGGGPAQIAEILAAMTQAVPGARFSVMPNAGYPEAVGGRVMYPAGAEYFAEYALTFRGMGATLIGGCCGTTPEHIAAMRAALDDPAAQAPEFRITRNGEQAERSENDQPPTRLMDRLARGLFTITVEVTPPRSFAAEALLAEVRELRAAGADLIDVADTPAAKMKMSAWAAAHLIQDRVGLETVLHFPTRGRNLLRIQGDLLAAHALDLRNLFVTMGDPTRIGDYPDANDAYDIAPSKLIDLIKHSMNEGRDMAGNSIGRPTRFTVGCALNMAADDLDHEIKVLKNKLASGSDFALGQAVFDPPRLEAFLRRYEEVMGAPFQLPVLMGIIPLNSLKHALFLHNEVPGIVIPQALLKRMEDAGENGPREGIRIARELMAQMRGLVQGAYVIQSGRTHLAAELVDAIASAPAHA